MAQQPSKWSHQKTRSAYFPGWKKAPKCTGWTITGPKHCPAAFLTQRSPVYNVLWSVWQKMSKYRQHRTCNTHRAEPIEKSLMFDPIKGCTEINLHNPCLLCTHSPMHFEVYGTHTKVHYRGHGTRIWSSYIISIIMTHCFHKRNNKLMNLWEIGLFHIV